ncbi:hypothetical protein GS506_04670 [Rhodococcus hoagii]|nr:hypothetical protein [Prescottella equi]
MDAPSPHRQLIVAVPRPASPLRLDPLSPDADPTRRPSEAAALESD